MKNNINTIFMYGLGALIVAGFFVLLVFLVLIPIPQGNNEVLYLAIGSLLAAFSAVVGYFYGSSAGSKQKTEILAKQSEKKSQEEAINELFNGEPKG